MQILRQQKYKKNKRKESVCPRSGVVYPGGGKLRLCVFICLTVSLSDCQFFLTACMIAFAICTTHIEPKLRA